MALNSLFVLMCC